MLGWWLKFALHSTIRPSADRLTSVAPSINYPSVVPPFAIQNTSLQTAVRSSTTTNTISYTYL